MNDRFAAEAFLRAAASGAIPAVGDTLVRTEKGWIFSPASAGGISAITPEQIQSLPFTKLSGVIAAGQVPFAVVRQHERQLVIYFAQMADVIDDAQVPESAVTQHEAALSLLFTQLTDAIDAAQVPLAAVAQYEAALAIAFAQLTGVIAAAQVPAAVVTQHQAALAIAFAQLTGSISSAQVPAAAVTQHQAVLSLLFTQLTDQIAAGQIPDGLIQEAKLAANSVGIKQLLVGSFDNLIMNPGLEMSDSSQFPYTASGPIIWTVAQTAPRSGANHIKAAGQSTVVDSVLVANGSTASSLLEHVSAAEGDQFYFEIYTRSAAVPADQVRARLVFRDEAAVHQGSVFGAAVFPTAAYQRITVAGPAPAGTAYVEFWVEILAGSETNDIYFDDFYARRMIDISLLEDVTLGAVDSGGAGYKVLRVPN